MFSSTDRARKVSTSAFYLVENEIAIYVLSMCKPLNFEVLSKTCLPVTEFLQFAINQEEMRQKWLASVQECQRLHSSLEKSHHESADLDRKLSHARRLLDEEKRRRRVAEEQRNSLVIILRR